MLCHGVPPLNRNRDLFARSFGKTAVCYEVPHLRFSICISLLERQDRQYITAAVSPYLFMISGYWILLTWFHVPEWWFLKLTVFEFDWRDFTCWSHNFLNPTIWLRNTPHDVRALQTTKTTENLRSAYILEAKDAIRLYCLKYTSDVCSCGYNSVRCKLIKVSAFL